MQTIVESVGLILVGWLLGLLGPSIVDAIKQDKDNARGRRAIICELEDFAAMLTNAAYRVRMSHGTIDKVLLDEIKEVIDAYPESESLVPLRAGVETFRELDSETLAQLTRSAADSQDTGLALQHYAVPLLDSRVLAFLTFDTDFQRQLLQLRREIAILDALVDRAEKYLDLTYAEIDSGNRRRASEGHTKACANYAFRAMRIVKKIRRLRSEV